MEILNKKNVWREVLGFYELLDKIKRKKNYIKFKIKIKNVLYFFIFNFNFFLYFYSGVWKNYLGC